MADPSQAERNALAAIVKTTDPDVLRNLIKNARRLGSETVMKAAFSRLCEVQPGASPGSLEHDVWQSIFALEEMLRDERGKTVRLNRTRQKIGRDGERKTVSDLTLKSTPSEGFHDLVQRGYPELTFEAVVLRHPQDFDDQTTAAARVRLIDAGLDPEAVSPADGA
ncbi:hypothetical protein [Jiella pelagia]|uniref:Uncharacterized protein n=1 Tax=Jiella pelagia TaxID=2986949 RepID=A0ABY7C6X1_9HYPH|nr:hypothetical protein [Jiella pelagia]WAP70804.1 hypothetical protein OH818_12855 [Jiella pelagia]